MIKSLLTLLSIVLFVPAHVNYIQVVYTAPVSKDISKNQDLYIYKGDSLDIVYSFWADGGVMAFMVINKSKTPVYIDWTKSAYVDHNTTANYYPIYTNGNSLISKATEIYKTPQDWYSLFAPYILSGYEGLERLSEEPITMLPPHTYLFRACYRILPKTALSVKKLPPAEIPVISGMRDKFPGWVLQSDSNNAMLTFGNTIVYDTQKDFINAKHIDNRFYIWQVLTFEEAYFDGFDNTNNSVNSPYHSDKRYFISNLKLSDID